MLTIWGAIRNRQSVRIAEIEAEADSTFGSLSMARNWMVQENAALGCAPISMLASDRGADEVRKVLAAIAYGGGV